MACPKPADGGGKGTGYPRPNGFIRAGATIFFAVGPTKKDFRCYPRPNRFIRAGLTQGSVQKVIVLNYSQQQIHLNI